MCSFCIVRLQHTRHPYGTHKALIPGYMPHIKLIAKKIEHLAIPDKRVDYYDTETTGLVLRVSPKGSKTYYYRYYFRGRHRSYKIGSASVIKLSDARKTVNKLAGDVAKGTSPQDERMMQKKAPETTKKVSELAQRFMKHHVSKLKPKTQADYKWYLEKYLLPNFGETALEDLRRRDISSFLEDVAEDHQVLSNRLHAVMSSMLNYGLDNDYIETNPMHRLKKKGVEKSRDRVLSDDEIKKIWVAIELQEQPIQALYKMLLLCGQRSGETKRMKWAHIKNGIWTVPAEETKKSAKNAKDHPVPLSSFAAEVLEEVRDETGDTPYVFASPRNKSEDPQPIEWLFKSVERLRTLSEVDDFTIHDLRRTVASNLAKLGASRTVIGKVLNHADTSQDRSVTAIYDQHGYLEEKQEALKKWGESLRVIVSGDGL